MILPVSPFPTPFPPALAGLSPGEFAIATGLLGEDGVHTQGTQASEPFSVSANATLPQSPIGTTYDAITLFVKGAKKNDPRALSELIDSIENTPSVFRRKHIPGILKAARQNKEAAYALRLLVVARADLFVKKDVKWVRATANRFYSGKLACLYLSIARPELFSFQIESQPVFSVEEGLRIVERSDTAKNAMQAVILPDDFSALGLLIVEAAQGNPNKGLKVLTWARAHPELFGDEEMELLRAAALFYWWAESAWQYINVNG